MRTIERDVIIVGAGPGGSTCSAFMKRMGLIPCLSIKKHFRGKNHVVTVSPV